MQTFGYFFLILEKMLISKNHNSTIPIDITHSYLLCNTFYVPLKKINS